MGLSKRYRGLRMKDNNGYSSGRPHSSTQCTVGGKGQKRIPLNSAAPLPRYSVPEFAWAHFRTLSVLNDYRELQMFSFKMFPFSVFFVERVGVFTLKWMFKFRLWCEDYKISFQSPFAVPKFTPPLHAYHALTSPIAKCKVFLKHIAFS